MVTNILKFTVVGILLISGTNAAIVDEKKQETEFSQELNNFLGQVRTARPQYMDHMFTLQSDHLKKMCDEIKQLGSKFDDSMEVKSLGIKSQRIKDKCASLAK